MPNLFRVGSSSPCEQASAPQFPALPAGLIHHQTTPQKQGTATVILTTWRIPSLYPSLSPVALVGGYSSSGSTLPLEFLVLGADMPAWTPVDSIIWFKVMSLDLSGVRISGPLATLDQLPRPPSLAVAGDQQLTAVPVDHTCSFSDWASDSPSLLRSHLCAELEARARAV